MDEKRIREAARAALTLSREQVAAGTAAMSGPLSRLGGSVAAIDVARNVAQVLVTYAVLGEEITSAEAIWMALLHRRRAFPAGPWGKLTDEEIHGAAALAAHAWERAVREARVAA